jgi:23S rRNA pseudouridine1911/1915/1917 synthase
MCKFSFLVEQDFNDFSVKNFLIEKGVSLELIKKIKCGKIYLNGNPLNVISKTLNCGDVVTFTLPPDMPNAYITPIKSPLNVLYEDDYLIAVEKQSGQLTHSSRYNGGVSLEQLVCGYFAPKPFVFRAINRLDKDTRGVVLIAKNAYTASLLGSQMKAGLIKKTYLAIVVGTPTKKHFIIEKPIKRQSENSIKRTVCDDGEYAKTECTVIENLEGNLSLLSILLHTGRTHQIRVHLSSVSHPLYADALYGVAVKDKTYTLIANSLTFTHPHTLKRITIKIQ